MHLFNIAAVIATVCATAEAKSLSSTLTDTPSLSILHGLLRQFDLLGSFNNFENVTLIAPTNQAYIDLAKWGFNVSEVPAEVARALLTYHVLEGKRTSQSIASDGRTVVHTKLQPPILTNVTSGAAVKVFNAGSGQLATESGLGVVGGVQDADITFDNGVIHTLNSSMVLPHNISVSALVNGVTGFLDVMAEAEMVTELESLKDVTVFIPTNDVLQKESRMLGFMGKKKVAEMLMYHVIPNHVLYGQVLREGRASYKTLQGAKLELEVGTDGAITVGGARVVKSDVILYGGVAHIVDDVLVPEAEQRGIKGDTRKFAMHGYQVPL